MDEQKKASPEGENQFFLKEVFLEAIKRKGFRFEAYEEEGSLIDHSSGPYQAEKNRLVNFAFRALEKISPSEQLLLMTRFYLNLPREKIVENFVFPGDSEEERSESYKKQMRACLTRWKEYFDEEFHKQA